MRFKRRNPNGTAGTIELIYTPQEIMVISVEVENPTADIPNIVTKVTKFTP